MTTPFSSSTAIASCPAPALRDARGGAGLVLASGLCVPGPGVCWAFACLHACGVCLRSARIRAPARPAFPWPAGLGGACRLAPFPGACPFWCRAALVLCWCPCPTCLAGWVAPGGRYRSLFVSRSLVQQAATDSASGMLPSFPPNHTCASPHTLGLLTVPAWSQRSVTSLT